LAPVSASAPPRIVLQDHACPDARPARPAGKDEAEDEVGQQADDRPIGNGEQLTLTQRSARRRSYSLGRGDQVVGRLRFRPGRRSVALAEAGGSGSLALVAASGRVVVTDEGDATATIATVDRDRGGTAVIRTAQGPPLRWHRTGRWHRWAVEGGDGVLLDLTAHQGLIRSSVRITARQELPEPAGLLLCLIGGFLALRNLQAEADGSAAAGGIVAAGS
jgi:hypothetical protein